MLYQLSYASKPFPQYGNQVNKLTHAAYCLQQQPHEPFSGSTTQTNPGS